MKSSNKKVIKVAEKPKKQISIRKIPKKQITVKKIKSNTTRFSRFA